MRTQLILSTVSSLLLAASVAFGAPTDVGSPLIDRPLNDSSSGVIYLYLGGTQPVIGPGSIGSWSFFDNEGVNANSKVTPLLYELTGANQWKIVSIGATRTSTGAGMQTHPFSVIAGITSLAAGKFYTFGFTHRAYTGTGAGLVAGAGNGGVVDFTGYNVFTDRWAYVFGTANVNTVIGTGGLPLDSSGLGGRIYSARFTTTAVSGAQVTYCTAGTSTNGCVPSIGATGAPSVTSTSGFTINVANLEGAKQGLIFYGVTGRAISPWASGSASFLCVKSPTQRMTLQSSGGTAGMCNGAFSIDWRAYLTANPFSLGAPFTAGEVVNAQAWYRDPPAVKTTNLSNALEFITQP